VLSGWLAEAGRPAAPVSFSLRIDGRHRLAVTADRPRADVAAAGLAGPNCGFAVDLPAGFCDGGEHELALLLPDGRNLALPGLPPSVALGLVVPQLLPARDVGLSAVLDLLRRNDFEAGHDPARVGPENAAAFNALTTPEDGVLFYASAGSRLVGYGRLDRVARQGGDFGVVALSVLAAYRRKGLGEALMRLLLHSAGREEGIRQVWLSVRRDNTPALRLYEKLGFRAEAEHPLGDRAGAGEIAMLWLPPGGAEAGRR
jgi:ribosomal protein S18 acetylase RimI-like enzyme